jgi:hypothetical protein
MVRAYCTYGGEEKCIQGFVGNPKGRNPFGRPKLIWVNNNNNNIDLLRSM